MAAVSFSAIFVALLSSTQPPLRIVEKAHALPQKLCAQLTALARPQFGGRTNDRDSVDGQPTDQVQIVHALSPDAAARVPPKLLTLLADEVLPRVGPLLLEASAGSWMLNRTVLAEAFIRRFSASDDVQSPAGRSFLPAHIDSADLSISIELSPRDAYDGGLTLIPPGASEERSPLAGQGSACVHPGNTLHFVNVFRGKRLSLVLFFYEDAAALRKGRGGGGRGGAAAAAAADIDQRCGEPGAQSAACVWNKSDDGGDSAASESASRRRAEEMASATLDHVRSSFNAQIAAAGSAEHEERCGVALESRCMSAAVERRLETAMRHVASAANLAAAVGYTSSSARLQTSAHVARAALLAFAASCCARRCDDRPALAAAGAAYASAAQSAREGQRLEEAESAAEESAAASPVSRENSTGHRFSEAESLTNGAETLRARFRGTHSRTAGAVAAHLQMQQPRCELAILETLPAVAQPCSSAAQCAQQAAEMLDRAISVLPSFAPAYAARGAALLQQGETRSALESLVRSLALRPSDARSHSLAGAALMRLAQEALGGERTHAASRKKTRRQQHNVIAAMLVRAEEHFSTARSLNPADARVQVNLDRTQRVLVALRALPR